MQAYRKSKFFGKIPDHRSTRKKTMAASQHISTSGQKSHERLELDFDKVKTSISHLRVMVNLA